MINIVFIGPYYYGTMASAQRIRNMIDGLMEIDDVFVSNIGCERGNVVAGQAISDRLNVESLSFYPSLGSMLGFVRDLKKSIKNKYVNGEYNYLYYYGYPSIESINALRYAKRVGYVIVFDIVEKLSVYNMSKSTPRAKIKHYTAKQMLNQIPKLGSVCFAISQSLVDYCNDICKSRIPVVLLPISIDVDRVLSYKTPINSKYITIFYGGSFGDKDGIYYLVKGFEKAARESDDIELVLTGKVAKGREKDIESLLKDSPFKDRIHFLGCVSNEDYYRTMANSDILCMPRVNSAYANAGFPYKLGEYLASGNIVVCTDVSDVRMYIKDMESALIIPPESSDAFAEAILAVVTKKVDATAIGRKGNEVCREYFDYKKVSKILYDSLVSIT